MFTGSLVALVTPFTDGRVDFETLRELVDFQVESGIDGVVPVGTTGESPTLSHDEHKKVIEVVVDEVGGRVPVVVGAGSNSTTEAVDLTSFAKETGADGSLQVLPYYNKPTQEGLYRHFSTIAEAVDLPMVLYNIPGRCGVNMAPETMEGDFAAARQWHNKLFPLSKALLSLATNPIPIKAAMAILKRCSDEMRLPMVELDADKKEQLTRILADYGLLR